MESIMHEEIGTYEIILDSSISYVLLGLSYGLIGGASIFGVVLTASIILKHFAQSAR